MGNRPMPNGLMNTNCVICNDHVFGYFLTVTDKPLSVGSFTFAGALAVFHKTNGQPFSVTNAVDAVAKSCKIVKTKHCDCFYLI